MDKEELKPLMVFKNTWWQSLKEGFVVLLSAESTESTAIPEHLKRGKEEDIWTVAFSYKGMGCSIHQWYSEEVLRCEYIGYLPTMMEFNGLKT